MGRIDSGDVFQDKDTIYPNGYILSVQADGTWKLVSAAFKKPSAVLASGAILLSPGTWHHFALTFKANRISALLDGAALATVQDDAHAHGMFALGTGWNQAQFDNLAITH
jgi:hypothetical protein